MSMITAIMQPMMALICMSVLIVGRFFYSVGYCKFGPKGRIFGAIVADLALLALLDGSIITIVQWPVGDDNIRVLPISADEARAIPV